MKDKAAADSVFSCSLVCFFLTVLRTAKSHRMDLKCCQKVLQQMFAFPAAILTVTLYCVFQRKD